MFISLAIGFSATQQSLKLFGCERAVFKRESNTGLNRFAYFLGKQISSIPDILLLPFIFLSMFYSAANPRGDFYLYYATLLSSQFALSGLGNFISVVMDPTQAQITAVVAVLILNSIGGFSPLKSDLGQASFVCNLSYGFWLMESLFLIEVDHYPDIFLQTKNDIASNLAYNLSRSVFVDIAVVFGMGVLARVFNFIALRLINHKWV